MQAVPSFIDHTETRHNAPDLKTCFICLYRQLVYRFRKFRQFQVR